MKPQLTKEAFAEWCEKKPADEEYEYLDVDNCACAQYAKHLGIGYDVTDADPDGSFWEQAEWAAIKLPTETGPNTFRALARRLRAQP